MLIRGLPRKHVFSSIKAKVSLVHTPAGVFKLLLPISVIFLYFK